MQIVHFLALGALLWTPLHVSAKPVKTEKLGTKEKLTVYACNNAVYDLLFDFTPPTGPDVYYGTMCNYPPSLGSFLLCCAQYSTPYSRTFNKTLKFTSSYCAEYGGTNGTVPIDYYFDNYENATKSTVLDPSAYNLTETYFYTPVKITKEDNAAYYKYLADIYYNWDAPNTFAGIFYVFFFLVFIIQGSFNLGKRLGYTGSLANNKVMRWYKGHISTPAIFNGSHTKAFRFLKIFTALLPTRMETLVVASFIIINIVLSCVNYHADLYPGDTQLTLMTELIADRTGLLSFGLIPLLIIFSGRNNILIQLAGIPYSSFIVYHKWVSRLMFIHAMVHSACWTAYGVEVNYLAGYYQDAYWIWGVVATSIAGLICFQALHMFRSMSYETFLVIHIVFAVMFMVGCFYHCYDLGYLEWLYASWALWIADRLMRVFRIFRFGSKIAQLESLEDDVFRVSVDIGTFDAFPGSYAFVYFMTPYGFWQSHPFTLLQSVAHPGKLVINFKAKRGMTKFLKNKLAKSSDGTLNIRIGIEGPYGHKAPVSKYSDVILLGGGSGLPGLLSHALDLSSRDSINRQRVKLIWIIKHMRDFEAFGDELGVLSKRNNVELEVYVTSDNLNDSLGEVTEKSPGDELNQGSGSDDISAKESTEKVIDRITKESFPLIEFKKGRPDIGSIIIECSALKQTQSLAIMTCGPPQMCDEARTLTANAMLNTEKVIDLYEELQVW